MQIEFKVHGVGEGRSNARTEIEGEVVMATVPCLEVELTTTSERNGTLTLRFVGAAIAEAREMFTRDSVLCATFDRVAGGSKRGAA